MKKKISSVVGSALLLSAIGLATPAMADYPAIPGLPLVGGSVSAPIAVDTTPKSIPANSKVATMSSTQKTTTATSGQSTVIKFTKLTKSTYAEATIKSADGKSSAFLGAVKTDANGNLQLPAFGLFKPGVYTLTVKVGKTTKTIKITVK